MSKKIFVFASCIMVIFLQGCLKDKMLRTYTILKPVYKEKSEVYAAIKSDPATEIVKPGKIYLFGNYIFLNDVDKGVHIIDNSNPATPVRKAFIKIPGNLDIAVKGNILYADLYSDLVVIDISNPLDAKFVKYIDDVFPNRNYTNGFVADSGRIIVDWISKDTTIRISDACYNCNFIYASTQSGQGGMGGGMMSTGPIGVAGSMARFALMNNFLYTVNNTRLTTFDVSNSSAPMQTATQQIGWNIETIFPFKNKLFIGSRTGMFIYDVSNPASPQPQGQFAHMESCDPVIADDQYAYVTLRAGNNCGNLQSQLDVINISNVLAPVLSKVYSLTNPFGLAKDGNTLFICDGKAGLKIYDASNPLNLTLKSEITTLETYDAIAMNGNLLVVAKDGLYQYDYTGSTLNIKSKIPVNRK